MALLRHPRGEIGIRPPQAFRDQAGDRLDLALLERLVDHELDPGCPRNELPGPVSSSVGPKPPETRHASASRPSRRTASSSACASPTIVIRGGSNRGSALRQRGRVRFRSVRSPRTSSLPVTTPPRAAAGSPVQARRTGDGHEDAEVVLGRQRDGPAVERDAQACGRAHEEIERSPGIASVSPASTVPERPSYHRVLPLWCTSTYVPGPNAAEDQLGERVPSSSGGAGSSRLPARSSDEPPARDAEGREDEDRHEHDPGEHEQDRAPLEGPLARRILRRSGRGGSVAPPARDEARRVLVDVDVAVEPEILRIRPQEALRTYASPGMDVKSSSSSARTYFAANLALAELDLGYLRALAARAPPASCFRSRTQRESRAQCSRRKRSSYSPTAIEAESTMSDSRHGEVCRPSRMHVAPPTTARGSRAIAPRAPRATTATGSRPRRRPESPTPRPSGPRPGSSASTRWRAG